MSKPRLAITMGDVAGISPEICAKALTHDHIYQLCSPLIVGDEAALRRGIEIAGADRLQVNTIASPDDATDTPGTLDLLTPGGPLGDVELGTVSATAGEGSVRFIKTAAAFGRAGQIDGIVTAPLNKAAMHAAGHRYPGHTELLAEEFGVDQFSLVLSAEQLYLFHITTHIALREACDLVTTDRTLAILRLAAAFARALQAADQPIGLAGLNPHASEGGLFGDEERRELEPAVEQARHEGIDVRGPLPADALLPQAVQGRWRFVVVCYHDQGHAAFKSVYGDNGINITAGLPIVRTSVDHGTAFDIAGDGVAREDSLVLAIERAAGLAPGWGDIWRTLNTSP